MARVTYGESITEYAGSIGGVTFLRNKSGPIAKLRTNPPVNPSPRQSTYQTNMAKCVAYWPTLSDTDKGLWDTFHGVNKHTTPWGEEKTLSGYQWFLVCNLLRLLTQTTLLSSPPAWDTYLPPDDFTLVATATYLHCEWATTWTPAESPKFYLSLPLRQSSLNLRRSLFYLSHGTWRLPLDNYDLTSKFETLANVKWADFYASANCSLICRIQDGNYETGLYSAFNSAIVKLPPPI